MATKRRNSCKRGRKVTGRKGCKAKPGPKRRSKKRMSRKKKSGKKASKKRMSGKKKSGKKASKKRMSRKKKSRKIRHYRGVRDFGKRIQRNMGSVGSIIPSL